MKKPYCRELAILTFVVTLLAYGCSSKVISTLSKGCDWLEKYQPQAQAAIVTIQTQYNAMVAQKNVAWVSAADVALAILGAVVAGVCKTVPEIEGSLSTANVTLPKIVADQERIKQLTAERDALQARNDNLNRTIQMLKVK